MKYLSLLAMSLFSINAMAVDYFCYGEGFDVTLKNKTITVNGNGIDEKKPVEAIGNYYTAKVNSRSLRSLTFSPNDATGTATLTLVKTRGVQTAELVCD